MTAQNAVLLGIVAGLGGVLAFHAVPAESREGISMIVGGCLALLRSDGGDRGAVA